MKSFATAPKPKQQPRNMMTYTVSFKFYSIGSSLTIGAIWKE